MKRARILKRLATIGAGAGLLLSLVLASGCATKGDVFHDSNMDFGSVKTVAILPFVNLSKDQQAAERVRDVLVNALMASGEFYPLPTGEVAKGIAAAGISNPFTPSTDDVIKLGKALKSEAVIAGVLREYGEVRSGTATSDAISLSLQMMETQTGRVVWSASSTKGGVSISVRLFGGGGEPMNDITEKAVQDLVSKYAQ
jgi:hypothetical protein